MRALSWAREMGFSNIVLEGDAFSVIRKINCQNLDFSPIGAYVEERKSLKVLFQHCSLQHIVRNENLVSHLLAQHGLSLDEEFVWIEYMPAFLHDSL